MIPVEAHLLLNHGPLVGLVFGLAFVVAGLMRGTDQTLRAALAFSSQWASPSCRLLEAAWWLPTCSRTPRGSTPTLKAGTNWPAS